MPAAPNIIKNCVYYDGACSVCNREIDALKATGSGLNFVNVHDQNALPYSKEQMLMHLHAVSPSGEVLTGLDANVYMWRTAADFCSKQNLHFRHPWRSSHWLASFMAFPLIYIFAKPIYNLWAKRRYKKLYAN